MRSSRPLALVAGLLGGVCWLAACSTSVPVASGLSTKSAACTRAESSATPGERELASALQRSPLYEIAAAGAPPIGCELRTEDGRLSATYRFPDGGEATATRDPAIEAVEQSVRLAKAPIESTPTLLHRAELAAYGTDGCGLDFAHAEDEAPVAGTRERDTVYRGAACNCQARVRRSGSGAIVGLLIRSAC